MARDRYQVVAVSDGSNARTEDQVARLLASHDRLIRHPTRNFIELYDAGIRQSEGRLVVLTEHHGVANADCLAEVELFFRQHEFDGACLKIDWVCLNEIARLKWSQRNQERLSFFTAPDHWNKFLFAGFAIQHDKLLSAGGLEYQYGLFLEVAVGAKLHAQGYRLGHAERAIIRHLDDNSFGKVLDFIRNFTEGEILFLANNDPEYCERYFGFVEEWGQRFSGGPERARSVLRLLCRALWCELLSRSPDRRAKPIARELARQLPRALMPSSIRLLGAYLGVVSARARFAFWWFNESRRVRALKDACDRMVHYVRQKSIFRRNASDRDPPAKPELEFDTVRFDVGPMGQSQCIGCHAREFHHGESFRWTKPVVTFRLALPPESYEVAIETRALRGSPSDYLRACFWNDHLIPRQAMTVTEGVVRFPIRREYFVAGETQQFSVICQALRPRDHGVADDRRLGMPVFSIRVKASNSARHGTSRQEMIDDARAA
jgi:hypothetical protein